MFILHNSFAFSFLFIKKKNCFLFCRLKLCRESFLVIDEFQIHQLLHQLLMSLLILPKFCQFRLYDGVCSGLFLLTSLWWFWSLFLFSLFFSLWRRRVQIIEKKQTFSCASFFELAQLTWYYVTESVLFLPKAIFLKSQKKEYV